MSTGTISALYACVARLLFVDDARKVNYLYLQNTEALCATRYDIAIASTLSLSVMPPLSGLCAQLMCTAINITY
jgi:hypothetical protein